MLIFYKIKEILKFIEVKINQLSNNYLRKRFLYCPNSVRLFGKIDVDYPNNKSIGDNSAFHKIKILGKGEVKIGKYCHFGDNVKIITQNHNYLSKSKIPYDEKYIIKNIEIGSFVWVGDDVLFTPGVRVGEGAIIGMGSVVTREVPPLAIVGGNPAKIIKYRDKNIFNNLKRQKKYHR
jgi:acetyltransferase-like isoleucine patch superfamily enzyme